MLQAIALATPARRPTSRKWVTTRRPVAAVARMPSVDAIQVTASASPALRLMSMRLATIKRLAVAEVKMPNVDASQATAPATPALSLLPLRSRPSTSPLSFNYNFIGNH